MNSEFQKKNGGRGMKKYFVLALHQLGFEIGRCEVLAVDSSSALKKASKYFKSIVIFVDFLVTFQFLRLSYVSRMLKE